MEVDVKDLAGDFRSSWGEFQKKLLLIFLELKVKTFLVLHVTLSRAQLHDAQGSFSRLDGCVETEEHLQVCHLDYEQRTGVLFDEGLRNDEREVDFGWFLSRRAVLYI
jgi:hypothetical protein